MNRIKPLGENLINQISAGEVIERPAGIVKELVENSIDAGASRIEISVSNGCRNIRIADNGSGIHPDDIELAFTNHATSKLDSEEALFDIHTLGFRGEALASIASIAQVTCITRTKDFEYGTKAEIQNSVIKAEKTGCALGTVFEVNNIFFNQPARLKFLKSEKTEFSYIQELVYQLASANPSISFILKNGASIAVKTSQNSDLLTRITELYSENIINKLKAVERKDEFTGMHVSGYVSTPDYTRAARKSIFTFINSRIVKCPVLSKAIDTAYRNMLPQGRYPFAVINLEINNSDIDVNVHPQKREIRYKNTNQVFNFVQAAVSRALDAANITAAPDAERRNYVNSAVLQFKQTAPSIENIYSDKQEYEAPFKFPVNVNKSSGSSEPVQKKIAIDFSMPAAAAALNVIGQFKNTYILVENEDNLELIDQHIAQERCIYEALKEAGETASQLLIVSDLIEIQPSDIEILEAAKNQLDKFGYKIEKISDNQVIFRKIPQLLSKANLTELLSELLENLRNSIDNNLASKEEEILKTTACKASVKAGDKLTLYQMEEIVQNLRNAKNPYTCPHGRPITHKIPLKEIASFFNRNV